MTDEKALQKTSLVFTLLQLAAILIALVGTAAAFFLLNIGLLGLRASLEEPSVKLGLLSVMGLVTVVTVSAGSYIALYHFFTLCQRLRMETAFTPANERGMGLIGMACTVCGAALLIAFFIIYTWMPVLPWLLVLFLSLAYLCIGLVGFALQLLLRRAAVLQQENDLTI